MLMKCAPVLCCAVSRCALLLCAASWHVTLHTMCLSKAGLPHPHAVATFELHRQRPAAPRCALLEQLWCGAKGTDNRAKGTDLCYVACCMGRALRGVSRIQRQKEKLESCGAIKVTSDDIVWSKTRRGSLLRVGMQHRACSIQHAVNDNTTCVTERLGVAHFHDSPILACAHTRVRSHIYAYMRARSAHVARRGGRGRALRVAVGRSAMRELQQTT
jgi:hypothetical protein